MCIVPAAAPVLSPRDLRTISAIGMFVPDAGNGWMGSITTTTITTEKITKYSKDECLFSFQYILLLLLFAICGNTAKYIVCNGLFRFAKILLFFEIENDLHNFFLVYVNF